MIRERTCCGTFEGSPHRSTCDAVKTKNCEHEFTDVAICVHCGCDTDGYISSAKSLQVQLQQANEEIERLTALLKAVKESEAKNG